MKNMHRKLIKPLGGAALALAQTLWAQEIPAGQTVPSGQTLYPNFVSDEIPAENGQTYRLTARIKADQADALSLQSELPQRAD